MQEAEHDNPPPKALTPRQLEVLRAVLKGNVKLELLRLPGRPPLTISRLHGTDVSRIVARLREWRYARFEWETICGVRTHVLPKLTITPHGVEYIALAAQLVAAHINQGSNNGRDHEGRG